MMTDEPEHVAALFARWLASGARGQRATPRAWARREGGIDPDALDLCASALVWIERAAQHDAALATRRARGRLALEKRALDLAEAAALASGEVLTLAAHHEREARAAPGAVSRADAGRWLATLMQAQERAGAADDLPGAEELLAAADFSGLTALELEEARVCEDRLDELRRGRRGG